eukprot:CAMPEP_0170566472 /NCGR_PEP_ID=MMETSP0211-20121228/79860_1 /TAXON_ID=311385 /ORGANISM="Pseudokeronopsis sp., Strain OXSARD2" /LENGTH=46 /DNA_ID= /DNA_START= /DNA_END= /DNA_ORIENTATION=
MILLSSNQNKGDSGTESQLELLNESKLISQQNEDLKEVINSMNINA